MQASQAQYPYTHKPILVTIRGYNTGGTIYGKTFVFRLENGNLWGKFCDSMFAY